jgi:hypothetical protein
MLLFEGALVVFRSYELLSEAGAIRETGCLRSQPRGHGGVLAGVAGLVLGILALVGIVPLTLMAAAVITYDGLLVLTSGESIWLNGLAVGDNEVVRQLARSLRGAAPDAQLLVCLAGLVLGILGLIGIKSLMLMLVALLAIGALALLRSSVLGGFLRDVLPQYLIP